MSTRITPVLLRFHACVTAVMLLAWVAAPVSAAEICSVTLTSAMPESIVVTDSGGISTAPMPTAAGHISIAPLVNVEGMLLAESIYKYFFTGDGQYRIFWRQGPNPSAVSFTCQLDGVRTHTYRYDIVQSGEGFGVELLLTVGTEPALSVDRDGDGNVDTPVTPDIAISGAAAGDTTPPIIIHTRLPDARHILALLDNGQDITESGQLLYSVDDGSGYVPYTEPITLDSRSAPRLLAIGRDLSGNLSDQYGFLSRNEDLPLCERLVAERETIQTVIASVLTQAVSDNLISSNHGISMASIGPGACLWKRDTEGNDLACEVCEGRYAPIFDSQKILVLLPDTVTDNTRDQLLERLRQMSAAPQHDLTELLFVADDRTTFESGQRSPEAGLASQMLLLEWLLQAEYVDLGGNGPGVNGASLDAALASLWNTGIPRLDGYEYSLQAENELLDTGLLVRIIAMNTGMTATLPQIDPYLGRLLRNQLNIAANTALRTAFSTLVADKCASEADLGTVSRQEFSSSACNGGPCASFAAYSLARATTARSQCPGLLTTAQIDALSQLVRIVARDVSALGEAINNECAANTLHASSLNFIREQQGALRPDYESLMQELAINKSAEHAQRQTNANAALARIASLENRPAVNLRFTLVNTGTAEKTDASIVMYVNGSPNGQQLDLSPAGETVQVFIGDYITDSPFYIEIDPATTDPNNVRNASFVLQTPNVENAAVEDDTFGSLQYYLFDLAEPICPNPTPVERPDSGAGG